MAVDSKFSRINRFIDRIGAVETPFSIELPDGKKRKVGEGNVQFDVSLRTNRAVKAISSLDEANIAEAYLQGDIDLDGDMISPFALRSSLDDRHPMVAAWRFIQPLLFGQVFTNKAAIKSYLDTYTSDWKDRNAAGEEIDFDQDAAATSIWAKKIS